jgi:hypothetical protein
MKTDPNSVKLKLLFAERQELLNRKRVNPTSFTLQYSERPKSKKRESNLVDFQNARAEKVAKEFQEEILSGKLYNELRKKSKKQ